MQRTGELSILITGGAGFIGSHLSRALQARGHLVTVLDNLSEQVHATADLAKIVPQGIRFLKGDVRSHEDWRCALKGQEVVVHLAAETGTGQSMYQVERYSEVNVMGTAMMLDILSHSLGDVRKLVVASSRAIYGEGKYLCASCGPVYPSPRLAVNMERGDFSIKCPRCGMQAESVPTDEDSLLHPTSVYGVTKLTQEQLVLAVAHACGIGAAALRYQNVYGPGQSLSNPYTGILSIFSTRIKNGNGINIFEDGKESRDFVYIDDVVAATVAAAEKPGNACEVFNIGSGVSTDVETVARTLAESYGRDVPIRISGEFRVGDIRENRADLQRARAGLGFEPKVEFATGIGRFVDWVNAQEVARDNYEQSIVELKARGLYR